MTWINSDEYDRGPLINGLDAIRDAGLHAGDALEQLRQSADYITEHYRDADVAD